MLFPLAPIAAALAFASDGGKVAFCGCRTDLGAEVEREIHAAGGEARYIKADVLAEDEVKAFIDETVATFGKLDVAFNNAGITVERSLHELSASEWDNVINTNLRGVFLAMKYEIPQMLKNGAGGNIVVTASSNAIATQAKRSAYTRRASVAWSAPRPSGRSRLRSARHPRQRPDPGYNRHRIPTQSGAHGKRA